MMQRVTYFREQKHMTQADLCRASGMSPQLLSLIEKGARKLTVKSAKTLSPALGVKWYELYSDQ